MFATNHVLAGADIGIASEKPWSAFMAGALSHLAMDSTPHTLLPLSYPESKKYRIAEADGLLGLAVGTGCLLYARKEFGFNAMVTTGSGILGAVVFDAEKPWQYFTGRRLFPTRITNGLSAIQQETPKGVWVEAAATAVLAAGFVAAVMFRRKKEKMKARQRELLG